MAGRSRDTTEDKLEKKTRTKAWFAFVLNESGFRNANQLAQHFNEGTRKWSNYAKGSNRPNDNTLIRCEFDYQGSKNTFQDGPENSYLFKSMFVDLDDSGDLRFFLSSVHRWFNQSRNELSPEQLIEYIQAIANENSFDGERQPDSALHLLSGCSLLLRFAFEDRRFTDRDIYGLLANILKVIQNTSLANKLQEYSIKESYIHWMIYKTLRWATKSTLYTIELCDNSESFEHGFVSATPLLLERSATKYARNANDFLSKLDTVICLEAERQSTFFETPTRTTQAI